ncbi:class I SAM-dependent methyltransferase [Kribbella sp. NPDC004875]|uniref:class I SAM-dependent methyltransferase n=1 Tax=Kribbella sp. NPDC004875 TaxID=3364107 RepID=UPI0036843C32
MKDRLAALAGKARTAVAQVQVAHRLRWRVTSREALFTQVYESAGWASEESGSGTGSELRATVDIREKLPDLLKRLRADSLLDAPCGDLNWMRRIDLPVRRYYGVDIVPSVIEENQKQFADEHRQFQVADLTRAELPRADVILCRDCLVHVSFHDAARMLENFRATGANWLLVNTYPEIQHNRNQFTGRNWRRLNLRLPPFDFPEPVESFADGGDVDPSRLGLWKLQELPAVRESRS